MGSRMIDKFMAKVARETVKHYNEVEILFDVRDFYLERTGDWYAVRFTSLLGCMPLWKYIPLVRYNVSCNAWECRIGTARFLTTGCPFFEIICELRGYLLPGRIAPDAVVLDAGPWNGISGMYFSAAARRGKVIFLEPDDVSADYLAREIELNRFSNAELLRKALFVGEGEIGFQRRDRGGSSIDINSREHMVPTISLSELASGLAPDGIDFIKMDIEGAEVDVADDIAGYISENPNTWASIASYHKLRDGRSFTVLEEKFSNYPSLVYKTAYPYHQTTFVAHADNVEVVENLQRLPSYEKSWQVIQDDLKGQEA